jgi:hypothetical protein
VVAIAGLLSLVAVLHLATVRDGHVWGDDFAQYVRHGLNIADLHDYADTGYIYNPSRPSYGPRTYPPVYPLLLAPIVKAAGINLVLLKVELVVLFTAAVAVWLVLAWHVLPPGLALASGAMVGFSPLLWAFLDNVLSEIPFMLFTYAALAVAVRPARRIAVGLGLGVLTYLAYGSRSIGIVLVLALVITEVLVVRRVRRAIFVALVVTLLLGLVQAWQLHGDLSYADQLPFTPTRLAHNALQNARFYAGAQTAFWDNGVYDWIPDAVALATLFLAGIGLVERSRRGPGVLEVFFALYVIALMVWPSPDARFLIPIFPLYVLYFLVGMRALQRRVNRRVAAALSAALLTVIAVSYGARLMTSPRPDPLEGVLAPEATELFAFVRDNTSPADVFVFRRARALSLYTNRPAATYDPAADPDRQLAFFGTIQARYLVVSDLFAEDGTTLKRLIAERPAALRQVYTNPHFSVYELTER